MSVRRFRRLFFDEGVVLLPHDGRILLRFQGDDHPLDLTADFAILLQAGLSLRSGDRSGAGTVEFAVLDTPDRMRVYHQGRRLSDEEIATLFEATLVAALRAALAANGPLGGTLSD